MTTIPKIAGQEERSRLGLPRLGLVGYGAFGRLAARHLSGSFEVFAFDPEGGPDGYAELTDLPTVAACSIVVLAVPVGVLEQTIADIAPHLSPDALVIDVGSVKVLPMRLMAAGLPDHVRVVGTHPLFGPQSAANGVEGLRIAVCPANDLKVARRTAAWCRRVLGLKVFLVSAEEHDREAATVQGLTHLIARVLVAMEPLPTRMTTASFERLMQAVEMVRHDSPAVYNAIERDNPFSAEVRERFFGLATEARKGLG